MQKISPLHQFILEIQQILESGDLKGQAHSTSPPSKNYQKLSN